MKAHQEISEHGRSSKPSYCNTRGVLGWWGPSTLLFEHWAMNSETIMQCKGAVILILINSPLPNISLHPPPKTRFSGVRRRVVFKRVVLAGVSPERKPGTRVHSDGPLEREPERGYVRMFPRNKKLERGHIRQNHPFTKPPFVSSRDLALSREMPENFANCRVSF